MFSPSGAESEGKLRDADAVSAGNVVIGHIWLTRD